MPDKTLNYQSPRNDNHRWKPSARQIRLGFLLLLGAAPIGWIVLVWLGLNGLVGPTGEQFRLDSGDRRYTYFGIPGNTFRMDEPERSTIVSLATGSAVLKPEWVRVRTETGFKMFYRAARWAKTNPQISKAVLEDVARYLKGQPAPPMNTIINALILFEPVGPGVWKNVAPNLNALHPEWTKEAADYLNSKALPIPSTAPAAITAPATLPPQG